MPYHLLPIQNNFVLLLIRLIIWLANLFSIKNMLVMVKRILMGAGKYFREKNKLMIPMMIYSSKPWMLEIFCNKKKFKRSKFKNQKINQKDNYRKTLVKTAIAETIPYLIQINTQINKNQSQNKIQIKIQIQIQNHPQNQ